MSSFLSDLAATAHHLLEAERRLHAQLDSFLSHGVGHDIVEAAKADASDALVALLPAIHAGVAIGEAAIASQVPPILAPLVAPVVDAVVAGAVTEAQAAVAPESDPMA